MPLNPEFKYLNASEQPRFDQPSRDPEPTGTVVDLPDMDKDTYAAWDRYAAKHTGRRGSVVRCANDLRVLCAIFLKHYAAGVGLSPYPKPQPTA